MARYRPIRHADLARTARTRNRRATRLAELVLRVNRPRAAVSVAGLRDNVRQAAVGATDACARLSPGLLGLASKYP